MISTGKDTLQPPCCVNKLLVCVKRACSCMSNNLRFHILKEGNYEFEELFQERSVIIKNMGFRQRLFYSTRFFGINYGSLVYAICCMVADNQLMIKISVFLWT